ncbi:hypothetical protein HanXRQr2_Chr05g0201661 [Helianthus annuus]|uniref:Uncharacterized protein n=1 Tax=Helianthus annuus TaxID=4232 RepID=A0A9K3IY05_HELAN|nr:hypothetical protein HanXRQr2_Chr05g0201661 [Helianthus annuus]KAJ0921688.1 hypothetical protein HanPSC8_Chr05g0194521 [Helianthus annuus]
MYQVCTSISTRHATCEHDDKIITKGPFRDGYQFPNNRKRPTSDRLKKQPKKQ